MRALVQVALKPTVLDPQGKAIQTALARLGFDGIADLRQAKLFAIELRPGVGRAQAEVQIERAAREILTNPVIEDFSIRWED